jgi:multidrug resistance protein
MEKSTLRQLSVLMATVFVDMVGFLIVHPLLPFYAESLGATATMIGLLVSIFAAAQLLSSPFWGRLSDRYGRRPLLIAGLLISAVSFGWFGFATSIWMLFAFRFIQGVGGGTVGVVQAYVSDAVPPEERAKALGWITAATSAGVMIGPLIGSYATRLGASGPGFVAAGLCIANAISAYLWLPEPRRRDAAPKSAAPRRSLRKSIGEVLREPTSPVASLIWVYAVGMMAFMAMNGILALYLAKKFGVTKESIGWFYTYVGSISLVMRALLLGPMVRRFGEVGVMKLGAAALAIGLAAIPFAPSIPVLAVAVLFVPVGTALLFPATTALVSRTAPEGETGQVMGVQQAFGGVARMLGPIWAGKAFDVLGPQAPFWMAAALMLGVGGLTHRVDEPQKSPPKPLADEPALPMPTETLDPAAIQPIPSVGPR